MTFMGLMFALAMTFSFLEGMVAIPTMPGVKLGLSNIVTMYCLFFLGLPSALTLLVLKTGFIFMTRGIVAATLSGAGGLLSLLVMSLLLVPKKHPVSYLIISITGGISHNIGQIIVARIIINSVYLYSLIPLLLISGVVMGVITGVILRVLLPYMKRLDPVKG